MKRAKSLSILIVFILCIPGLFVVAGLHSQQSEKQTSQTNSILNIPAEQSGVVLTSLKNLSPVDPNMSMNVLVTLGFRNQGLLNSTLLALQNPLSPDYHKYLSKSSFISEFSPSAQEYDSYVKYFRSQDLNVTNTYSDRISIGISSNASLLEKVFHTSIVYHESNGSRFYAPDSNLSIDANFGTITGLSGLSDQFRMTISPLFLSGGGGTQLLYGADMQNAYQLNKLYQGRGYPTGETIATILWSGTNSTGSVAPYVPSDISTYLANNIPAGEPISKVYGLPVGGAPLPGPSAANDTTQANYESTLDLEMAGSTAPGATIVEVYGPTNTMLYLDMAFAAILNPSYNNTLNNSLSHVVAISNSWGGTDSTDSSWSQYEQEAASLGITVLAASGDNGNTNSVSPNFPATVGYNGYGTLAVGGTQTNLSGTQSINGTGTTGIASQSVWYDSPGLNGYGSQGGVSSVYSEPSWQVNSSDASTVISDENLVTGLQSGRGTPDIAGVGADMQIYLSRGSSSGYMTLYGTSIASPLVAGVIATIDSYLGTPEGFMNPFIYKIGQEQYQGTYMGPPPFYFIHNGSNAVFHSANGYNLVDGWGSINAYNFVLAQQAYNVTITETGLSPGVAWYVNISGFGTVYSTSNNITLTLPDGNYTYNISQAGYQVPVVASGTFDVSGRSVNITVAFEAAYNASFEESGLPAGNKWYIYLTSGPPWYNNMKSETTANYISFILPNGTYSYSAETGNSMYESSNSSFIVNGSNATMLVHFSLKQYNVSFEETGLPSNHSLQWGLNFNGTAYYSKAQYINLTEVDGEYSVHPINNSLYYAVLRSNSIVVNGSNLSVTLDYSPYAFIDFIVNPANASVFVDGVLEHTKNGHLNLTVLPGFHTVTVEENGYRAYYNNSTIGGGQVLNIQVSLLSNASAPIPMSTQTFVYVGIALTIPIVAAAYSLSRRKRK